MRMILSSGTWDVNFKKMELCKPKLDKSQDCKLKYWNRQGGSNMTGNYLYKRTHKSVPVIFEPPCNKCAGY